MEYFLVRYDSRVIIYDRRGFIRLATGLEFKTNATDLLSSKLREVSIES